MRGVHIFHLIWR